MAGHYLIDRYLVTVASGLPPDAVDELSDGLTETFDRHLAEGLDPAEAAEAAIAEFGDPDQITAAFARHAPGRRAATAFLATGPIFGALWGTSLIVGEFWTWPIPSSILVAFATLLLVAVAALVAATSRRAYGYVMVAAIGCGGLILLDTAMLVGVALAAPTLVWPMALAIPASLARIVMAARAVPRVLTQ
ncbi:MAG: permease prefix domain 1-containing protein [Nocardioidaceae bacterium]